MNNEINDDEDLEYSDSIIDPIMEFKCEKSQLEPNFILTNNDDIQFI
jgi:hypothetical protein